MSVLETQIKRELKKQNAVLLAHYYVASELQLLAEKTGGIVADSLEMARFGKYCHANVIVIAGVKFMGETAKILAPEKTVLVLDNRATCSLDISCPIDDFNAFCAKHKEREVVVYANTSAAVKAKANWVVTSGSALKIVEHLHEQGEKILWAPDRHLGAYIRARTHADMLLWHGSCVVHEAFKADALIKLKEKMPGACVLVHPESPMEVIELADVVGSTTELIKAVRDRAEQTYIVATDNGIFHKMREIAPNKKFIEAPSMGIGATCESCAHCEWMAMNNLEKCLHVLKVHNNEINIEPDIISQAQNAINRLLDFTTKH